MLPVLSREERGMVILQLASRLAGREYGYGADTVPDVLGFDG